MIAPPSKASFSHLTGGHLKEEEMLILAMLAPALTLLFYIFVMVFMKW